MLEFKNGTENMPEIKESLDLSNRPTMLYSYLMEVLRQKGKYANVLKYHQQMVDNNCSISGAKTTCIFLLETGVALYHLGNYDQAETDFKEIINQVNNNAANETETETEDTYYDMTIEDQDYFAMNANYFLGEINYAKASCPSNNIEKVFELYNRAIDYYKLADNVVMQFHSYSKIGRLYLTMKKPKNAKIALLKGLKMANKILSNPNKETNPWYKIQNSDWKKAMKDLIEAYKMSGNDKKAEKMQFNLDNNIYEL